MTIRIVAIGGTVNPDSSTEQALNFAAEAARREGADVKVFGGDYLRALPHYRGEGYGIEDGAELVDN